jgi:hypothetical protein
MRMKRTDIIHIRMFPIVKDQWQATAKNLGISLSEFIEYCVELYFKKPNDLKK